MLLKAATGNNATTPRPRESDSTQRSNDRSLATILVGIVLVFMICHACRFFLAFYQVHCLSTEKASNLVIDASSTGGSSGDNSKVHGARRQRRAARVAVRSERGQPPHADVHLPLELHHLLRRGLQVSRCKNSHVMFRPKHWF